MSFSSCRSLRLALPLLGLAGLTATVGCESEECTSEYRIYQITIARDIATPFAEISNVEFTACAGDHCETVSPIGGRFNPDTPYGILKGSVSANADGSTHLDASMDSGESSNPLSLSAVDAAGTKVLDVSGTIAWKTVDVCHAEPVKSSF